jgi:hypothetical protein
MLNDRKCSTAKPGIHPDKPDEDYTGRSCKLFDGGGLYLEVLPTGSKLWRLKYRYLGKEKRMSLGHYPLVPLKEAREKREENKKLLSQNINPSTHKQDQKTQAIRNAHNTFEVIAREWHENQKGHWSENHTRNVLHKLETDVFPHIGNRPIAKIEAPDLLDVLRKIEKRGALDIAARTRQICGQVFRYGIQTGKCKRALSTVKCPIGGW